MRSHFLALRFYAFAFFGIRNRWPISSRRGSVEASALASSKPSRFRRPLAATVRPGIGSRDRWPEVRATIGKAARPEAAASRRRATVRPGTPSRRPPWHRRSRPDSDTVRDLATVEAVTVRPGIAAAAGFA
jgi:hypothetical protein